MRGRIFCILRADRGPILLVGFLLLPLPALPSPLHQQHHSVKRKTLHRAAIMMRTLPGEVLPPAPPPWWSAAPPVVRGDGDSARMSAAVSGDLLVFALAPTADRRKSQLSDTRRKIRESQVRAAENYQPGLCQDGKASMLCWILHFCFVFSNSRGT